MPATTLRSPEEVLLIEAVRALNEAPRFLTPGGKYHDNYELAAAIDARLKTLGLSVYTSDGLAR